MTCGAGIKLHSDVQHISLEDLLKNREASGRPKDLADFDELGGNRRVRP